MTELDAFCRACMCQVVGGSIKNIVCYNIFNTLNLADNLMRCSNLSVTSSDQYPQLLCGKCYRKVLEFCEFQRMCRDSLNAFKEMLAIETHTVDNTEIESVDTDHKEISVEILVEDSGSNEDFLMEYQKWNETNKIISIKPDCKEIKSVGNLKENMVLIDEGSILENSITNVPFPATEGKQSEKYPEAECDGDQEEYTFEDYIEDEEEISLEMSYTEVEKEEETLGDILEEETVEQFRDGRHYVDTELLSDQIAESSEPYPAAFQCDMCPEAFSSKDLLECHLREHQSLPEYRCTHEDCAQTFKSISYLQHHLKIHTPISREIYICDFNNCGAEFTTKADINNHMRTCHNFALEKETKRYVCGTCGASVASARSLRDHLYIHVDRSQWPFVCNVESCSKRFRTLQEFSVHKRRHAGIKPYICPHCNKRFCTSSNLSVHVNFHTLEKKWPCNLCTKVCYTPANLRLHMQQKHGYISESMTNKKNCKRVACSFCKKTFSSITGKKYHEMLHTGEKPFACEECGRTFRQPSQLTQHKKIHMQETREMPKNFHCHSCDRAYTSAQALKYHELKHTGEKPFTCEQCGMKFRFPSSLSRHRKQNLCRKYEYEAGGKIG